MADQELPFHWAMLETDTTPAAEKSPRMPRIAGLPAKEGLAAIAAPPLEDAAWEAVALVRASGTPEPVWSRSIGRPTLVDAWISTDELDDQSNVLAAFACDRRPPHAVNLIVDANFQGLIQSAFAADNPDKVRREWTRASGGGSRCSTPTSTHRSMRGSPS